MMYGEALAIDDSSLYHTGSNWQLPQQLLPVVENDVQPNYIETFKDSIDSFKSRFDEFVKGWTDDVEDISSFTDMVLHKDYQTIKGLGPRAVPLLLKELQQRPHYWFDALQTLILANYGEDVDPVDEADRGNLQRMTEAWLLWGEENGFI